MAGPSAPALPQDWTSTWLALLVSVAMGFLASLGVAAASGAESLARSWTDDLEAKATVSVSAGRSGRRAMERALEIVSTTPGVVEARALEPGEVDALLEPWLGDAGGAAALALPRLIDVTVDRAGGLDAAALETRLRDAGLAVEIDAHGEWVDRLRPAAERIRALAFGALLVIGLAAGLTVALACSAGLATQAKVIDVLKLVGAEDGYITRIFVRRFQILVFGGSALGAAAAALTLLFAPQAQGGLEGLELAPLLPTLRPEGGAWAQFVALPLAFALIATIAARISVTVALRRREG
ncbi:MAG: hypothetical protein AAFW46_14795 [Pseudomonadota bacterium]